MASIQRNISKGLASAQDSRPYIYTPLTYINTDG